LKPLIVCRTLVWAFQNIVSNIDLLGLFLGPGFLVGFGEFIWMPGPDQEQILFLDLLLGRV
jgi:hypothetical protein